jgi:hypothetical protein
MILSSKRNDAPLPVLDPAVVKHIRADLQQAHGPDTTFLDRLDAIERTIEVLLSVLETK